MPSAIAIRAFAQIIRSPDRAFYGQWRFFRRASHAVPKLCHLSRDRRAASWEKVLRAHGRCGKNEKAEDDACASQYHHAVPVAVGVPAGVLDQTTRGSFRRFALLAQTFPVQPMKKEQVVEVLETIATLLELQEENPFKIRAYTNAARSIETWGGNLRELAAEDRLTEIPGVGKAIAGKIGELVLTGSSKFYDDLRAQFPEQILELFSLPGLGSKKIKALYEKLAVNSIADLAQACEQGRVAELPGFGKTTQEKLAKTIADRAKHAGSFSLGAVAGEAEQLQADLKNHPASSLVSTAGSYRRRKEIVRDLDFIVATKEPAAVTEFFVKHPLVASVIARGATKTSVRLHSGVQADLRVVSGEEYPFALGYFTGSKEHNIVLRNRALQRGWTLNEYPARARGRRPDEK